jgi:hypothetical protein
MSVRDLRAHDGIPLTIDQAEAVVSRTIARHKLLAGTARDALPARIAQYFESLKAAGLPDPQLARPGHYRAFVRPRPRMPLQQWWSVHERHCAVVLAHSVLILAGYPHPLPVWPQLTPPAGGLPVLADTGCTLSALRAVALLPRHRVRRFDDDVRSATIVALAEAGGHPSEIAACRIQDLRLSTKGGLVELPGHLGRVRHSAQRGEVHRRVVALTPFGGLVTGTYTRFLRRRHLGPGASLVYSGSQDRRSASATSSVTNTLKQLRRECGLGKCYLGPASPRLWAAVSGFLASGSWFAAFETMGRSHDPRAAFTELGLARASYALPELERQLRAHHNGYTPPW